MASPSLSNILLAMTFAALLSACDSDNDDDDDLDSMPPTSMMGEENGNEGGEEADPNTVDLATTPVYITSSCDTAPAPESTAASVIATAPAGFLVDTLVGGRLSRNSTDDNEHFWTTQLEAGIHYLVMDSGTTTGRDGSLGLQVDSIDGNGDVIEQLLRTTKVDNRIRVASRLILTAPTTLRLRISPVFGLEEYLFGIFLNGSPVPSPFFSNCPTIRNLSLATTETFSLGPANDPETNEVWFETTLEDADHSLTTTATIPNGDERNIIYSARFYSQFGQDSRETDVLSANEIGTTLESSGSFAPISAGTHWIRFRNGAANTCPPGKSNIGLTILPPAASMRVASAFRSLA